jgi:hypothetical protein
LEKSLKNCWNFLLPALRRGVQHFGGRVDQCVADGGGKMNFVDF